ncbi:hypothetical protein GH714_001538 [Hevea brasiliensis]|uniref:Sulfurtransferase n=1 Tax=Hevea brasiliensis TaxID=3981 RepID=A0A6A6MAP5_HEVBR|nr:hypothetical protein GH714_001538 [Hevea brasiliensis]
MPPGPKKLPIIGNMHQLIGHLPHRRLRDLAKKCGPIMHLQFGQVSTIVISSSGTAKEIMKTHNVIFAQRPFVLVAESCILQPRRYYYFCILWRLPVAASKNCTLELLSSKRVQLFQSIREEEVSNLNKSLSSSAGSPVNLSKMLFSSSCCALARNAKTRKPSCHLLRKLLKRCKALALQSFPSIKLLRVITGIQYRLEKLHKRLDMLLENIINEHRIYWATAKGDQGEAELEDILHTLLNLQEHGDLEFPLTTNNIKAIILKRPFHIRADPVYASYKTSGRAPRVMASSVIGSKALFSAQSLSTNEPVVSVDWLHANLTEPDMKVLDASWYMPDEKRNPIQEYQVAHIPGALFFDVDGISDRSTNLPHMLPSEEAFAAAVSALGIENKDGLVVYDGKGIFSAARVWWMFRVFGHDNVWVLDGGLPRWRASGYDVESSASGDAILKASAASEAIEKVYQGQAVGPITFQTKFQPHLVWTLEQMLDASQTLLPADELKKRFDQEGISLESPVVTSCGTGVTACILALGLHRLGNRDVAVYDGSWTEWGAHTDTPITSS